MSEEDQKGLDFTDKREERENLLKPEHIEEATFKIPTDDLADLVDMQYVFWNEIARLVGYKSIKDVHEYKKHIDINWSERSITLSTAIEDSPIHDGDIWDALKRSIDEASEGTRKLDLDDDVPF